jgi:beta-glucosidase
MVLKRFRKVELKPGESSRVVFKLSYKDLGLWNTQMQFVTEPGEFEFMFAKSAKEIQCRETVKYID